jgi:retron-type reverse transcriptase
VVVSFDHVNHDILMGRVAEVIRDKRVLHLMGKYLRRGAMVNGVVTESEEGTPQGGPRSPLLANIYLDALDQELDQRGHSYCRYADDCNIYVGSQAAAERTLASVQDWIEKHLRLKVNAAKKRYGEGLGTQVPGVSTGSQDADRNRAGEPGEIPDEGSRDVERPTKSHQ